MALLLGCGLAASVLRADPDAGRSVLTRYQDFWVLEGEAREREHDVRFEAEVLFYDPVWRVMWLENEGMPLYCNTGTAVFPVRTGQRVLLECRVLPARGFEPIDLRLTAVGDAPPRVPPVITGRPEETESAHERLATMAGLVERQEEVDPRHLRLFLVVDGRAAVANVLVAEGDALPDYTGAVIELTGLVFVRKNSEGMILQLDLWIDGLQSIRSAVPLGRDPRFDRPAVAGEALRDTSPGTWVRVRGEVRSAEPGVAVILGDEANQYVVRSAQKNALQPGEMVEAIGVFEPRGPELVLRNGLWRPTATSTAPEEPARRKLRRVDQVLELGPDEAQRGQPVDLWGVVTWCSPEALYFYVQDSTRGVGVWSPGPWESRPPFLGATVRVFGRTRAGPFAPQVEIERFATQGAMVLPKPPLITLDHAVSGAEEGKRVELRGYLQDVVEDAAWTELALTTPTGEFRARLPADPSLGRLRGAVVRLRGVCTAIADERGELVGIRLLIAERDDLVVEEPPVADPFSVAVGPISALRRFSPLQTPYRRVRILGTATYVDPGRLLVVQDGAHGIEVLARDSAGTREGDGVEAVGFTGRMGNRIVLREAQVRRAPGRPQAKVLELPAEPGADEAWSNLLVRGTAEVDEVVGADAELHILLKAGGLRYPARLSAPKALQPRLVRGGVVECTGVYRIEYDAYGVPSRFHLRLRAPEDIVVLRQPPWLSRGRALLALAVSGVVVAGAFLWAGLLRRRVAEQTRQIRAQLEKQAKLEGELQKAAKLESLGLLAGGIAHDFNNLLTVVLGNITLAMLEERAMEAAGDCLRDAERGAQRAKDLTHQLLTFARGGDPLRSAEALPEIVREASEFVLRGSAVRCEFDFAHGLWPADVDRGQIGQVVHNLVLNAVQAMPQGGVVRVKAGNGTVAAGEIGALAPGRYVWLRLADTGPGMPPEVLARIFDPYFTTKKAGSGLGLATVHSIVRRHRGHIEVHSEVGHGTVFRLWLPAAEAAAGGQREETMPVPRRLSGRVLVMDDEEDIRRFMVSLLRRLGLEPVAVADGAAAVRAYTEAREAGRPFALVITDLTVPGGMGGREAMETLRRIDPEVRAIVSSGYSNDPVLANFRDYGFCGMVEKPYAVEKLMACIGEVLACGGAGGLRQSD